MKYVFLAAVAATAIAAPAASKDNSPYVGIEGGVTFPQKQDLDGSITFNDNTNFSNVAAGNVGSLRYKPGYDLDVVGGYDFGMFRLEGELGYKRSKVKDFNIDPTFLGALNTASGNNFTSSSFDLRDHTTVLSAMVNGLADFGGNGGLGAYVGAGAGYADVKQLGGSQGKFAWQILAGAYMPVSNNVDIGLKYRYFDAGRVNRSDAFAFNAGAATCGGFPCTGGTAVFDTSGHYRSHSVLASLIYNFGAPPPAPAPIPAAAPAPPPPPPPATQTCPDGSVILATDACPPPPPPPPPAPPPAGERG
jgi:opacity protein-like surface antigen